MRDTTLLCCPKTGWTVQPINVDEPFEVKGKWFAWWDCPCCDWDENTRNDPDYSAAHPGPHLLNLTKTAAPALWESKYAEVTR